MQNTGLYVLDAPQLLFVQEVKPAVSNPLVLPSMETGSSAHFLVMAWVAEFLNPQISVCLEPLASVEQVVMNYS